MPRKCGLCRQTGHNKSNCPNAHYEGDYNYKGEKHGKGTYEYKIKKYNYTRLEGAKYKGDWVEGKREGQGVMTWTNGDYSGNKYDGEWKNGKREGKGVMIYGKSHYKNIQYGQKQYEGEWKNDNPHGKGVMYYLNGDKYDGVWNNGSISTWGDGTYMGVWEDG